MVTVVGTRPEIIRLSEILKKCELTFDQTLVFTGQNKQSYLSNVFFTELGIRPPDITFNINGENLGDTFGNLFRDIFKVFDEVNPDALLILGDTNSAFSALIAKRLRIPVYHIEAGLRSFDENVPEEVNRRIIDRISDFNLVYTEHARFNLLREGYHPRQVVLVGSPMFEVINSNLSAIKESNVMNILNLERNNFYLVSIHRQENVDSKQRLTQIFEMLSELSNSKGKKIVMSLHPRTLDKINKFNISIPSGIKMVEPLGFFEFCNLQINASLVISDSGSISEEASILGFKAVTLRDSMERPEALESGSIGMCGVGNINFMELINYFESAPLSKVLPESYFFEDTSERVVKFILSTVGQYKFWLGLR